MLDKFMRNLLNMNSPKAQKNSQNEQQDEVFSLASFLNLDSCNNNCSRRPNNYLTVSTWETNSTRDMFDFESNKNLKVKDYKLHEYGCDVYLSNQETSSGLQRCFIVGHGVYNANAFCGRIDVKNYQMSYLPGAQVESYRVVSNEESQKIQVGNILKLGRLKFIVRSMYNGKTMKQKTTIIDKINKNQIQNFQKCSGTCKFCLSQQNQNDILISPCKCKGSCAEVHISCLKQWLSNKVTSKSTELVQFVNYDNFQCQICKQELPITFAVDGQQYSILNMKNNTKQPFILLEGIQNSKNTNNVQIKIKFGCSRETISLGRGNETDVRLQDVSISRKHCYFHKTGSGFEILNNKAKFGTLIKLESGMKTDLSMNRVQIGKIVLEASQKKQ